MTEARRSLWLLAVVGACGRTVTEPKADGGEVVNLTARDISAPLREMAKVARPKLATDDEAEPVRRIPHPLMRTAAHADGVLQDFVGSAPTAPTVMNFEGMGASMTG